MLLRTYQGVVVDNKGGSFEQGLLAWLKEKLKGYSDINLDDGFKSGSFANGKVILGLLNEYDPKLIQYKSYGVDDKVGNCSVGLKTGEEKCNVPALMEAGELASGKVSEKNLVLYVSLWFNAFKELDAGASKESLMKRIKELEEKIRLLTGENTALHETKQALETTVEELTKKLQSLEEQHKKLLMTHEETMKELSSLKSTYLSEKGNLEARVSELSEDIKALKANSGDSVTKLQNAKDEITRERDALREELKSVREQLTKEKKELEAKNAELQASLNKSKKMREELEEIMKKQQEHHSKSIHVLRKHLLQHVHDMHVWKVFLEQDREYESEDLHIVMENELEGMEFAEQVSTLDTAISEENERLAKLLKEREAEAAEVVSVNIGKKKHRVKKGLEADYAAQKEGGQAKPATKK
jgi:DNA repair exonuclease SbcCD ATPase subunit